MAITDDSVGGGTTLPRKVNGQRLALCPQVSMLGGTKLGQLDGSVHPDTAKRDELVGLAAQLIMAASPAALCFDSPMW
jgi:hypothetical protein